ncbi:PP2C family protein-serine/threonine phosphatase [Clavibacter tessellarius]|uniref:PP2C family protein-serine/threonine phosphatase n=1 Tax=Clavibacter tessellarius TaxID=31965 RepID=UPI00324E6179
MTDARSIAIGGRRIDVSWAARTDVGSVRAVNEDGLLADPPVWLVADGMGGHAFGDRASATLVETFGGLTGDQPVTRDLIVEAVDASNEAIGDLITGDDPPGTVAGTTLAGIALVRAEDGEPLWMVFNVGDSRVYAWIDGRLQQVTVDHSAVQEPRRPGAHDARGGRAQPGAEPHHAGRRLARRGGRGRVAAARLRPPGLPHLLRRPHQGARRRRHRRGPAPGPRGRRRRRPRRGRPGRPGPRVRRPGQRDGRRDRGGLRRAAVRRRVRGRAVTRGIAAGTRR